MPPGHGTPLDNVPTNRCIGCGPANPEGLQLAFRKLKGRVRSELKARDTYEGWPDRLHSGVLYIAMVETANWTVYGLEGRIGLPVHTTRLRTNRWVATGEELTLEGTIQPFSEHDLSIEVRAQDEAGDRVAALERDYQLIDEEDFLEAMGYEELPAELEGMLPG